MGKKLTSIPMSYRMSKLTQNEPFKFKNLKR